MVLTGRTHRLQIPTKGATLAFTEQNKRRLHARLCEVIGTEEADILMEQLPPITWTEFATKRDLEQSRHSLEISIMKLQHSVEIAKLELTGSILELTATMERGFRNQSWKMFTAIMSSQLATVGLLGLMINSLR
jgi:hypothetical protein